MKYKKLLLIFSLFILAIFFAPVLDLLLLSVLNNFGIYGAILLGYFYSFSFTGGAVAVMTSGVQENFFLFSVLAAFGAMLADLTILKLIHFSLKQEVEYLFKTNLLKNFFSSKFFNYKYSHLFLGFLIIGSPLPDEVGVAFLSQYKKLSRPKFLLLCFFANFAFLYLLART